MGPLPTCTTTPAREYMESAPRASSVVLLSFSSRGNTTLYMSLRILQQGTTKYGNGCEGRLQYEHYCTGWVWCGP